MVKDVLKLKSGGEAVLQEYQETETLTDATRRQMINILMAHMIDTHGYFNLFFFKPNNCMAIVQIKITSLISSLKQLPTKAIRKQNALGIVMLFPSQDTLPGVIKTVHRNMERRHQTALFLNR